MAAVSDELLIRYCSPTLAGLKTGNLFTCAFSERKELAARIRAFNKKLCPKGLRALPLRWQDGRALIYLYRPGRLAQDLKNGSVAALLRRYGYPCGSPERCIATLMHRLRSGAEFPHEIGLFLSYPPEDVQGFIENQAANCKCVGCWKVYGDKAAAERTFRRYKACTDAYYRHWVNGVPVEALAVAAVLCELCRR